MKAGQKVIFSYIDKYEGYRETEMILSNVTLEEEMSAEVIKLRLSSELQKISTEVLIAKGIIFAARNLLKRYPDATDISIFEKIDKEEKEPSEQQGGLVLILVILAVIVAIISFPLLVMLGMRGKLFFKRFYNEFQGEKYKDFVKKYSFVGVGLYAVFIIMILVDKIFELYLLVGPAFGVMFFGGVAYFIVSLILTKKQFIDGRISISFIEMIKHRIKNEPLGLPAEEKDSSAEEKNSSAEVVQDNSIKLETLENKVEQEEAVEIQEEVPIIKEAVTKPVVEQKNNNQIEKSNKENRKNKLLIVLIIIMVVLVLVIGGVVFWMVFGKINKNQGGSTTSESTFSDNNGSESEGTGHDKETQLEEININDYVGYWRIEDYYQKELTIHSSDGEVIYFSLWYFQWDEISYVQAELQGNVAHFSLAMDGGAIKGTLTFVDKAIIVNITDSGRMGMPVEIMEFTEYSMSSVKDWDVIPGTTEDNFDDFQEGDAGDTYEYILPYSSEILLTYEDLYLLTDEELRLARNEIYARHGRKFNNPELQAYFDEKEWYYGYIESEDFSEELLSDIERQNVDFIMSYEP